MERFDVQFLGSVEVPCHQGNGILCAAMQKVSTEVGPGQPAGGEAPRPQASTEAERGLEPQGQPHPEAQIPLVGSVGPPRPFSPFSSSCLKVKTSSHPAFLPVICSLSHGLGGRFVISSSSAGPVGQQDRPPLRPPPPPPEARPWGWVGKAGVVGPWSWLEGQRGDKEG